MTLPFGIRGVAVDGEIERRVRGEIEADAGRRTPHVTDVHTSASHRDFAEAVFVPAVQRPSAKPPTDVTDGWPGMSVVADVRAISDRQGYGGDAGKPIGLLGEYRIA